MQWLGSDPYAFKRAERAFIANNFEPFSLNRKSNRRRTRAFGSCWSRRRTGFFIACASKKRSNTEAFSDAGGMTRLNLDGLTKQTSANRLLGD